MRSSLAATVATTVTLGVSPRAARATGGLDVDVPPSDLSLRILLAPDRRAVAPPVALDARRFTFAGKTYRGTVAPALMPDGREGLINALSIEEYLYGVVGQETPRTWPAASLQAQAIIARTFAVRRRVPARPYDLTRGELDQVYGGAAAEWPEVRAAVDATAGLVVMWSGMPADLAYSSCCGGRTADAAEVWLHGVPYLRSVDDPYCAASPDFRWRIAMPWTHVESAFRPRLAAVGAPRAIELRDVGSSGRAREVQFDGVAGALRVPTTAFRETLGLHVIRSGFLRAVDLVDAADAPPLATPPAATTADYGFHAPRAVVVAGAGRGHGVGLCQWGAREQARAGRSAAQILAFYFAGTSIGRLS